MTGPLAKSTGTTLLEHTQHVVTAMEKVAEEWLQPEQRPVARRGAVLHDLGKAHPYFQAMVSSKDGSFKDNHTIRHRHEISSLLFLPLFPQEEWPVLVEMVVSHHKSISDSNNGDSKGKGLLDFVDKYDSQPVFERHAEAWEDWHKSVFPVLSDFGITPRTLTRDEAKVGFDFALNYCEDNRQKLGRNRWRGLLMSADHLASALEENTETRTVDLFRLPDLTVFANRAASADTANYPLAKKTTDDPRPHTLVIAPTGAGKTDYLVRRCQKRIFYLLPFQASINAMFLRFQGLLADTDIRRIHAASRIEIGQGQDEESILQRHPGAAIKVMTPHQIASLVFGTSGHEAAALDVEGQDVILDEVHVYDTQTQAMVLMLVRALIALNARVHIGSATIPAALETEILRYLGGTDSVYTVRLTDAEMETYDRHIVHHLADEEAARKTIANAIHKKQRVMFISNRVQTAQERYTWAKKEFPDIPILLLHSRFRRCDRAALEKQIDAYDKSDGPCLVCATQVIEVSLDISFDTLITDTAPFDSLIQRFGRVNRRRETKAGYAPVYVIAPPDNDKEAKPYSLDVLTRSFAQMPNGELLEEKSLQTRINAVYPSVDIKTIDTLLAIDSAGNCNLQELRHHPRSVLLEALEIETASCIRASDEEEYKKGRGSERMEREIPLSWRTMRPHAGKWRQLPDVGNNPFIVPDAYYDEAVGLLLNADGELQSTIINQTFI